MPHRAWIRTCAFLLSALPGFTACTSCEDEAVQRVETSLVADRENLDFGPVFIGTEVQNSVRLSSVGGLPLRYETALQGRTLGYAVGPAIETIPRLGSIDVSVFFRPEEPGDHTAQIIFRAANQAETTVVVELRGRGVVAPDCEDGNGCTMDRFNATTGRCEHLSQALACDDFNACTVRDQCRDGVCLGESFLCDDHNACTDDLCDPRRGCIHPLTKSCDDDNPCTVDTCNDNGCQHQDLPNGSPCNDSEQCTFADICFQGSCVGVSIPEGSECDDGDPCSTGERCEGGACVDPDYTPPQVGELKFMTHVGPLADGASSNPIVDRDGTVLVGVQGGALAIDECGELLWEARHLGTPRFSAAVSVPGVLSLPIGPRIVDLDTSNQTVLRQVDVSTLFPPVQTASTATVTIRVIDLALRASGALLISASREIEAGDSKTEEGLIGETDPSRVQTRPLWRLGAMHASRLAIDADEAIVAILRKGPVDAGLGEERVVRFGLDDHPEATWSTNPGLFAHSELALGQDGEVYWTHGLQAITRNGDLSVLIRAKNDMGDFGTPVLFDRTLYIVDETTEPTAPPKRALFAVTASTGHIRWSEPLDITTGRVSPVVDARGNVFTLAASNQLLGLSGAQDRLFLSTLPVATSTPGGALALTPKGVVVGVMGEHVFGVTSLAPLANTAWPRHRRDNLSTGHR